MIVVIKNRILSIHSVFMCFYHTYSVTVYILLVCFILHLLYDVFVDLDARRPTASELC